MIDLETLGTDPATAPVIQIGAVAFELGADRIADVLPFQVNVDATSNLLPPFNRSIKPDTVAWWAKTDPALLVDIMAGPNRLSLHTALQDLSMWLDDIEIEGVWAKGPTFDIAILETAYKQAERRIPWSFRLVRDVRTMEMIAGGDPGVWEGGVISAYEQMGKAHDALVDCLRQTRVVQQTWQKLIKHEVLA